MQKEALDRRLSLRQHSGSTGAFTSAAAAQKNRGRKIAPTLVQLETNANSFPALSSQAFATPHPQLLAEASAKDLCANSHEPGKLPCCPICILQACLKLHTNAYCMTYHMQHQGSQIHPSWSSCMQVVMCKDLTARLLLCKGVMQVQLLRQQHGSVCTPHPQQAAPLPGLPLPTKVPMQTQLFTVIELQQVPQSVTSAHTQPLLLLHLPRVKASPSEYPQALWERRRL